MHDAPHSAADIASARDQLARLQAICGALSAAMPAEQIGQVVLAIGLDLPEVASVGLSMLRADGRLHVFAHRGFPPGTVGAFEALPRDIRTPKTDAIVTRTPVFIQGADAFAEEYPALSKVVRASQHCAWATLPLLWNGEAIGVMGLAFARPQRFTASERAFFLTVAQLCAGALVGLSPFTLDDWIARQSPDELRRVLAAIDERLKQG